MNTYGIDLMGRRRRRRHSAEFKAMVIGECMRPGVSMAAVALEHSLIANMLRKWVIDAEQAGPRAPMAPAVSQEVHTPALTDDHGPGDGFLALGPSDSSTACVKACRTPARARAKASVCTGQRAGLGRAGRRHPRLDPHRPPSPSTPSAIASSRRIAPR